MVLINIHLVIMFGTFNRAEAAVQVMEAKLDAVTSSPDGSYNLIKRNVEDDQNGP